MGVTLKVADGPAVPAILPAISEAVPAAMDMPNVPIPLVFEMVTV